MNYLQEEITAAVAIVRDRLLADNALDFCEELRSNELFTELVTAIALNHNVTHGMAASLLQVGIILGVRLEQGRKVTA